MMRLGFPGSHRLGAFPVTFKPKPFLITGAATMAVVNRSLILKCDRLRHAYLALSNFSAAELIQ